MGIIRCSANWIGRTATRELAYDPLLRWLYLLEEAYKDEHEMEVLMEMSEGLRAFAAKYNRSLNDPNLRQLYELDLSARMDEAEVISSAEDRGRVEGRVETITSVIRNMLLDGAPIQTIYKYVSAPRAEIDTIVSQLKGKH